MIFCRPEIITNNTIFDLVENAFATKYYYDIIFILHVRVRCILSGLTRRTFIILYIREWLCLYKSVNLRCVRFPFSQRQCPPVSPIEKYPFHQRLPCLSMGSIRHSRINNSKEPSRKVFKCIALLLRFESNQKEFNYAIIAMTDLVNYFQLECSGETFFSGFTLTIFPTESKGEKKVLWFEFELCGCRG